MYESYYGLREKPFNLLPDPDYLYMSRGHQNVYTHLEYAVEENKSFAVITGEIGSGKTTLINYLLSKIKKGLLVGLINNTHASPEQFIKMICQEYELDVDGKDKAELLDILNDFLLRQYGEKKRVTLIIDEAQNLSSKTIEEIRMLSNLETEKHHLIQIILVGQPDLNCKLQQDSLRQFSQRVTVHCHLTALNREEVREFIRYRLKMAGSEDLDIFDPEATEAVLRYSKGIPRLINIICDAALVYGYADEIKRIGKNTIQHVIKAREAGGLFSQDAGGIAPDLLNPAERRIASVEKRIERIEALIARLDKRIDTIEQKREKRDTVVLELFYMLKDSFESRSKIMQKLQQ